MENGVVEVGDVLIGDWFMGSVVGERGGGVGFEEVFEGGDEGSVGSSREVEVGGGRGGSAERRERREEDEERETEEREG